MDITTLINHLNVRLETHWLEHERAPRHTFSASSAGQCHRKQILSLSGFVGREMDTDQKRMLMQRTVLHDGIVRDLAEVYRENGYTVLVEEEMNIIDEELEGRTDLIAYNDKEYVVLDVKTVHPNITNWTESLPKEHNVRQVQCYLYGRVMTKSLERKGILFYVPMGQGQLLAYEVEPDDDWVWEEYADLNTELSAFTCFGELPAPLPLVEKVRTRKGEKVTMLEQSWECGYCSFADTGYCTPNRPTNKTGDRKEDS